MLKPENYGRGNIHSAGPYHTPRAGSIQHSHFNFHSEAEGRISAAVLLCLNRGVHVEACRAATPGYLNAAGVAF
jgi:hypothetical protein